MHLNPLEQSMPFGYHHSTFSSTETTETTSQLGSLPLQFRWLWNAHFASLGLGYLGYLGSRGASPGTWADPHPRACRSRSPQGWRHVIPGDLHAGASRRTSWFSTVSGGSLRSVDLGFYHDLCIIISYNNLEYIDISLYHIVSHDGHPIKTLHYDFVNSPLSLTISHCLTVDSCPGEACFH